MDDKKDVDPPAYAPSDPKAKTPTAPTPTPSSPSRENRPQRSASFLRAQIIANGNIIIRPQVPDSGYHDKELELVVAQKPVPTTATAGSSKAPENFAMGGTQPRFASSSQKVQHYAMVLFRRELRTVRVFYKGEPKDTVEEALESLLEYTEKVLHRLVTKFGRAEEVHQCNPM